MKTKIIYISGNEIFDMNDIRAAFEQVRDALALGPDTVLFGVPVDRTDALSTDITTTESVVQPVAMPAVEISEPVIEEQISDDTPDVITDVIDNEITDANTEAEPTPVENIITTKKSRGRPKSAKKVTEQPADTEDNVTDTTQGDKVVSILSVLTSKPDEFAETDTPAPIASDIAEPQITDETPEIDITTEIVEEITLTDITEPITEIETVSDELPTDDDINTVSIDDMITDDAPVAAQSQEQTLEQLLESMAPLREDIEHEQHAAIVDSADEIAPDDTTDVIDVTADDDDATLEQLATEFAENQDKIATAPKTGNQGKIGKLKNILPFKKARRDDSGLMGDLFGWAGIAANDEDFAIPGFFTNAASKK